MGFLPAYGTRSTPCPLGKMVVKDLSTPQLKAVPNPEGYICLCKGRGVILLSLCWLAESETRTLAKKSRGPSSNKHKRTKNELKKRSKQGR